MNALLLVLAASSCAYRLAASDAPVEIAWYVMGAVPAADGRIYFPMTLRGSREDAENHLAALRLHVFRQDNHAWVPGALVLSDRDDVVLWVAGEPLAADVLHDGYLTEEGGGAFPPPLGDGGVARVVDGGGPGDGIARSSDIVFRTVEGSAGIPEPPVVTISVLDQFSVDEFDCCRSRDACACPDEDGWCQACWVVGGEMRPRIQVSWGVPETSQINGFVLEVLEPDNSVASRTTFVTEPARYERVYAADQETYCMRARVVRGWDGVTSEVVEHCRNHDEMTRRDPTPRGERPADCHPLPGCSQAGSVTAWALAAALLRRARGRGRWCAHDACPRD